MVVIHAPARQTADRVVAPGPAVRPRSLVVQRRLEVGRANDPAEREADAMAERVLRSLARRHDAAADAPCESSATRIRRSAPGALTSGRVSSRIEETIEAERARGHALPATTLARMESGFGASLGHVRIHRSTASDALNDSLGAQAFTTGSDVFLRRSTDLTDPDGERLLAHELTHVLQQDGTPQRIQRKLGLEFEFENWQTVETKSSHFAAATDTNTVPLDKSNWRRIKKGKALARGPGFELQADDDPNDATQSDLEIVTDAFDEPPAGLAQLRQAMTDIVNVATRIAANFDAWWGNGHLPRATDLGLQTVLPSSFLYPDRGTHFNAKPQTTIGLSLAQVAKFMEDFFVPAAETGAETASRAQGRQEVIGFNPGAAAGPIMQAQGQAPGQARNAIGAYLGTHPGAPAQTPELVGLVSLIVAYLRMADQGLVRSYAKTIAPVMARTDFARMFSMLSRPERDWYRANKGQPLFDLVHESAWHNAMSPGDEVFSQGVQNPTLGVGQAQGLSRGKWIKGIATGTDFLSGKKFPDKSQRDDIEGLGAYGKKTDKFDFRGVTHETAIMELRAMRTIPIAQLPAVAERLYIYTFWANRGDDYKYGQ